MGLPSRRVYAIFDIHGRSDLLRKLLGVLERVEKIDFTQDLLIFCGDYIDRGPDSKGVIDIIIDLQKRFPGNVIALRGNHEALCIQAYQTRDWMDFSLWSGNGGDTTVASYGAPGKRRVSQEHVDWMASLPLKFEIPGFFFSHAPVPIESRRRLLDRGQPFTEEELTWTYDINEKHTSRTHDPQLDGTPTVGVCGHVIKLSHDGHRARQYPHYIFGDSGCGKYPKAPLCAIEVTSRREIYAFPDRVFVPPEYRYEDSPEPTPPPLE